jgi:hypothetical protein
MVTDFLLDLGGLVCEDEGEKEVPFTDVCPYTLQVELQSFALQ